MEQEIYRVYSSYLKEKYGEKVYKLPINLPVTCPNKEEGCGCTFCSDSGTGFEALSQSVSVTAQLENTREKIERRYGAHKFIAYFQNYTNTYLPLNQFEGYINEAARVKDIVEISISTRPDCIHRAYLDILQNIKTRFHINITIELGLQTANYHTLQKIHRGHGLAEFLSAVLLISDYGFEICVHVIPNLPFDTMEDVVETAKIISVLPVDQVKLHSLYIAKGTSMAVQYEKGEIEICSKQEYYERLAQFLMHLRKDIVVERLFSRIPEQDSIFSNWGNSWWKCQEEFLEYMNEQGFYQGKLSDKTGQPLIDKGYVES